MQKAARDLGLATKSEPAGDREVLNQIHALSVESVELLRSLVQMLLPRAEPREGPSLEELLAALLASQRDQTVMLRQIGADIAALHAKLPVGDADHETDIPLVRPNGRHRS